jgi:hypothetical protein
MHPASACMAAHGCAWAAHALLTTSATALKQRERTRETLWEWSAGRGRWLAIPPLVHRSIGCRRPRAATGATRFTNEAKIAIKFSHWKSSLFHTFTLFHTFRSIILIIIIIRQVYNIFIFIREDRRPRRPRWMGGKEGKDASSMGGSLSYLWTFGTVRMRACPCSTTQHALCSTPIMTWWCARTPTPPHTHTHTHTHTHADTHMQARSHGHPSCAAAAMQRCRTHTRMRGHACAHLMQVPELEASKFHEMVRAVEAGSSKATIIDVVGARVASHATRSIRHTTYAIRHTIISRGPPYEPRMTRVRSIRHTPYAIRHTPYGAVVWCMVQPWWVRPHL